MSERKDYYAILGVTDEEKKLQGDEFKKAIKAKYRKIAIANHPDRNPNNKEAEQRFKDAAEAYNVLSDDKKRSEYDNPASNFNFEGFNGGGMSMEDILRQFTSGFGFNPFGSDFGFSMNVNSGVSNGPQKGSNMRLRVGITLSDILNGSKKTLKYKRKEQCDKCHGTGMDEHSRKETCGVCGGTGTKMFQDGMFQTISTCPHCHGKGHIITNPCSSCGGSGLQEKSHTVDFTVPKGAMDGMQFIIKGGGNQGAGENGINGDLYVLLVELEDDKFVRTGNDIRFTLNVPVIDCIIGGEADVRTLEGKHLTTKIPECVEEGTEIMFKGYGLPVYGNDTQRGNLIGIITHKMPKTISEEDKKTLRELRTKLQ